jgi:HYR domain-containing protein/type IX secretion system substrate protein
MKKKLLLSVGICILFMANTLLAQQVLQQLTPQPGQTQIYNVQTKVPVNLIQTPPPTISIKNPIPAYQVGNTKLGKDFCGTKITAENILMERNRDQAAFQKQLERYLNNNKRAHRDFQIQIHIVTRNNGSGGASIASIRSEIANYVNPYFVGMNWSFLECGPEKYINSTAYYNLSGIAEGNTMSAAYNVANVLNIYYVGDAAGACGWARFPWDLPEDYIVIDNGCATNKSSLVHEIGHYFGLYHTHETAFGVENVHRGPLLALPLGNPSWCTNCTGAGDLLCDTPADPNLSGNVTAAPGCVYTGGGSDGCSFGSRPYTPYTRNIMSYSQKACRTIWSPQQEAKMLLYGTVLTPGFPFYGRSYLNTTSGPPANDLCADAITLSCGSDVTVDITCALNIDNPGTCVTNGSNEPGVWYKIAGTGQKMTISTCNPATDYDSKLSVWSGTCGTLSCVTGDDDFCGFFGSAEVTFCTQIGTTYYVYVYGFGGDVGTAQITVSCASSPPVITCPANITQNNDAGQCGANVSYPPATATDDCPGVTITYSKASGSFFPVGNTTVTATATDAGGLTDVCTFDVTVVDAELPTVICYDVTYNTSDDGGYDCTVNPYYGISQTEWTINDNCNPLANVNTIFTHNAIVIGGGNTGPIAPGSYYWIFTYPLGVTTVDMIVTDAGGNTVSCSYTVTVLDDEDPVAVCQPVTIYLDANGEATLAPGDVDDGSYDNCGPITLSLSRTLFTCEDACEGGGGGFTGSSAMGADDLGPCPTVVLTVTDEAGNTATCQTTVTVLDTIPPTAICKFAPHVQLDSNGWSAVLVSDVDDGSFDNCGIDTMFVTPDEVICDSFGTIKVLLTVIDYSGNMDTCSKELGVNDFISPTAVCKDTTIYLNANGRKWLPGIELDGGTWDNCPIIRWKPSKKLYTCADVGLNMVTLTVFDQAHNSDQCVAQVTVVDPNQPVATCNNLTRELDGNGQVGITAAEVGSGVSVCGIDTMWLDKYDFTCADVGANTVILTVVDNSGNMTTCTAIVTIEDNEVPNVICMPEWKDLDANGNTTLFPFEIDNGSTDNCGIASRSVSPSNFTCANVGVNTVILLVTDVNGNTATCSTTVTIIDNMPPTAKCKNIVVMLDGSGNASITAGDVDDGSSDNCDIASMSVSPSSFTCADTGANTVTLTVTDVNGKTASCQSTVTVLDTIPPTITCPADITTDNDAGVCGATVNYSVSVSDNCGTTLTQTGGLPSGSLFPVGTTVNTWKVTDPSGNMDTCSFTVTVNDTEPPVLNCHTVTRYVGPGKTGRIVRYQIPKATDNCDPSPSKQRLSGPPSGAWFPVGSTTVTYQAWDAAGNVTTCSFEVIVISGAAPKPKDNQPDEVVFDNQDKTVMNLYPNPTNGTVNLNITKEGYQGKISIEVYNLLGRKVMERTDGMDSWYNVQFDLGKYAAGQYMIRIKMGDELLTRKLILMQ